jgi:hypothetical protein
MVANPHQPQQHLTAPATLVLAKIGHAVSIMLPGDTRRQSPKSKLERQVLAGAAGRFAR